jgi:D-alanyl-D-alanine carboxypeptidase
MKTAACIQLGLAVMFSLVACSQGTTIPTETAALKGEETSPKITLLPTSTEPPVITPTVTATLFPIPTLSSTQVACADRYPEYTDLWTVVTAAFGLAPGYVPPDLVMLGDYLPGKVALPELLLRRNAAKALGKMIAAMLEEGLEPTILSTYRSFSSQAATRNRWEAEDPGNASQVSALPGHSEHQLGTAVDLSTPRLKELTGDPAIRFSHLFAETEVGIWLADNAHEYGFTLTNPPGAEAWTGLIYEPWHYRYVGIDMATYLHASGYFLAEIILSSSQDLPCIP